MKVIRRAVRALLAANQIESNNYRYTRPAPSIYEQQWLWDSCFHAIIYCHLDPEMAKDELRSLVHHRGVETEGMIPHMVYWQGGGKDLWGHEFTSFITQPPMIADAALRVYNTTQDKAFLREIYGSLVAYYDWLAEERDHDGDYLISIIHPWESGWDASPRWDHLLGLDDPTDDQARQARQALATELKETGQDLATVTSLGLFHVEPVDFNAIYAANLSALAQISASIGQQGEKARFEAAADNVREAINAKMWDETAGFYWDLAGNNEEPTRVPTAASFLTLFAQVPSAPQAQRLADRLRFQFSAAYPVPTVAVDHPSFTPERYWRGSTWLNVNWFIVQGLRLYGHLGDANTIAERSLALVEKEGFWEYYDPKDGRGLGSKSHSWSGIVLDMMGQPG